MTSLKKFRAVPPEEWPHHNQKNRVFVWVSSEFLVQQFLEPDGVIRLTINNVKRRGSNWADAITWDELQEIKRLVGFGGRLAVEIYPEDRHVVNVANMRHLWILPERPAFAWRND